MFVFPKEITKIRQKDKVKFFPKRGYEIRHRVLFFLKGVMRFVIGACFPKRGYEIRHRGIGKLALKKFSNSKK